MNFPSKWFYGKDGNGKEVPNKVEGRNADCFLRLPGRQVHVFFRVRGNEPGCWREGVERMLPRRGSKDAQNRRCLRGLLVTNGSKGDTTLRAFKKTSTEEHLRHEPRDS